MDKKELAEFLGVSVQSLYYMEKKTPQKYERLKSSIILERSGFTNDDLELLAFIKANGVNKNDIEIISTLFKRG